MRGELPRRKGKGLKSMLQPVGGRRKVLLQRRPQSIRGEMEEGPNTEKRARPTG